MREAPDWTGSFLESLGSSLVSDSELVLVTGGLEDRSDGTMAVDAVVVKGAESACRAMGVQATQRIITMLPPF